MTISEIKEQICDIHNRYARAGGRNTVLSATNLKQNLLFLPSFKQK